MHIETLFKKMKDPMKVTLKLLALILGFNLQAMDALKIAAKELSDVECRELNKAFDVAVRAGDDLAVAKLLERGIDVNRWLRGSNRAVHIAIQLRSLKLFDVILHAPNFDQNVLDSHDMTPLIYSIKSSCLPDFPAELSRYFVSSLLALKNTRLDAINSDGFTALEVAAVSHPDFVGLLLDIGAQPRTFLFKLESRWAPGVADVLKQKKIARPKRQTMVEKPALHFAILKKDQAMIVQYMEDPNIPDEVGETPLMFAMTLACNQQEFPVAYIREIASRLIAHPSFDPNRKHREGYTALMRALDLARKNPSLPLSDIFLFIVKRLLALRATDPNIENEVGTTAIDCGPMDMVYMPLLLNRGTKPKLPKTFVEAAESAPAVYHYLLENSEFAVHFAIAQQDQRLFDQIIALPTFNPNALFGVETPLMWALIFPFKHREHRPRYQDDDAAEKFTLYVVRKLIDHPRIQINLKNEKNECALDYAMIAGKKFVELLMSKGPSGIHFDTGHYKFAEKNGAPGVLEFLKGIKATLPAPREDDQGEHRAAALPSGVYTFEELNNAYDARQRVLQKEQEARRCAICKKAEDVKVCLLCRQVYYCSKEHQRQDWPNHKLAMHQPQECSICNETENMGRQEKCGHVFHEGCIKQWITTKKQSQPELQVLCPVCLRQLA